MVYANTLELDRWAVFGAVNRMVVYKTFERVYSRIQK